MSEANHSSSFAVRLTQKAGVLGYVGGPALAAAYLTHPPSAPPETVASAMWIWIHVGFMISLICGIFLLMALLALYLRKGGGVSGVVGAALAIISLVFVFGLDYSEVFIFPVLAVEFSEVVVKYGDGTSMPSVAFAFPATGIVFLAGFVVLAWALKTVKAVKGWVAYLTIAGTFIFALGLSGLLPMIVVRTGSVVFGMALIALGRELQNQAT